MCIRDRLTDGQYTNGYTNTLLVFGCRWDTGYITMDLGHPRALSRVVISGYEQQDIGIGIMPEVLVEYYDEEAGDWKLGTTWNNSPHFTGNKNDGPGIGLSLIHIYPPNVNLCKSVLLPLGIDFREAKDVSHMPFGDNSFDIVINRHGNFDVKELFRILKPGGIFVTQQVGAENDRELVNLLLPDTALPFPEQYLEKAGKKFTDIGFQILQSQEAVSYTHLDVYKRQQKRCRFRPRPSGRGRALRGREPTSSERGNSCFRRWGRS